MTSSPHGPYIQGCKRATMVHTERCKSASWSKSQKVHPSSDCGLQPARMKLESLVIADQHAAVNGFLSLVHTARQVMGAGRARSRHITVVSTARSVTGTKS